MKRIEILIVCKLEQGQEQRSEKEYIDTLKKESICNSNYVCLVIVNINNIMQIKIV